MRVLSLWQPWASLWVAGAKLNETRSWPTKYRGLVAVQAAKHWTEDLAALCRREPFRSALELLGFRDQPMGHRASLPFGKVLGVVEVTGCLPTENHDVDGDELEFGDYGPGRFYFTTSTKRLILDTPVHFVGGQGLRHAPPHLAARLEAAWGAR